jgi:hypothetical protein
MLRKAAAALAGAMWMPSVYLTAPGGRSFVRSSIGIPAVRESSYGMRVYIVSGASPGGSWAMSIEQPRSRNLPQISKSSATNSSALFGKVSVSVGGISATEGIGNGSFSLPSARPTFLSRKIE